MDKKTEDYRGFSADFANEVAVPQISFWLQNVFKRPSQITGIGKEYLDDMRQAVVWLQESLMGPSHRHHFGPLYDYVLRIDQVEILKGVLGDNYRFHKNLLDQKKLMGTRFMNTAKEEKALEELNMVFLHRAPNLADSVDKELFVPFDEFQNRKTKQQKEYDVFLCHASEDKDFVGPLALALRDAGVKVWYDNLRLEWGDDLRSSIDRGLSNSRYGVVVFSNSFLKKKKWTEHELNGLFAREGNEKIMLPIWHDITREDLLAYSPSLADRLAKNTGELSIDQIVEEVKKVLRSGG